MCKITFLISLNIEMSESPPEERVKTLQQYLSSSGDLSLTERNGVVQWRYSLYDFMYQEEATEKVFMAG